MSSQQDTSSQNRLLVLDGHSMAFRAFYALPAENFQTSTGQHTNAVYGFLTMLLAMIRQQEPTHVAVAFDLDTPTFRSEAYGEYKAGRKETPHEFYGQIDLIGKVMEALNVATITVDGYEADDIVATLSTQAGDAGWKTLVVSGDRDAFQLINDDTVVLYPKKGVSDIPPLDAEAIKAKYKVYPAQYPELAALVGESADNLPGVPGVGPGFAAKWLNQYGSLQEVLDNAEKITGKKGEALREHRDDVVRNRELNALVRDLDLPVALEAMKLRQPDKAVVDDLFDALEFNRVRQRVFDTFGERLGTVEEPVEEEQAPEFTVAGSAQQVNDFLAEQATGTLGVHVVLDGPPMIPKRKIPKPGEYGTPVAVALSSAQAGLYVDLESAGQDTRSAVFEFLADPSTPKAVYDLKALLKAVSPERISGVVDDVLLSAYILQPDRRGYELADLVQSYLYSSLESAAEKSEAKDSGQQELVFDDAADVAQQTDAARAAWMVLRLSEVFSPQLVERGATDLLKDLEIPLSEVLAAMELYGVAISMEQLRELRSQFTEQAEAAQESAWASIGGQQVNLGSPKQLQGVLFDQLDMPKTRKTKTGYSTDVESLNDLLEQTGHPFLQNLMHYRDHTKLKQTVQGLIDLVAPDDRIHTTFSQTAAATGRLSSLNPNLQNIPVRTEAGRKIRDVFVAGELGGKPSAGLLTADYSQIEMRIMAHMSQDENLIQAFIEGEDLHRFVGANVFEVAPEDVTPEMRSKVKAMSYGLAYGLSSFGLSKQLRIPVDEARELMSTYFDRFGSVQKYLRDVVKQAKVDGYTSTMLGRRRYLPDLDSDDRQLRDMAERAALNAPIQGSAADIIKKAMLGVQGRLEQEGLESRMLLQIHDELILEVAPGEEKAAESLLVDEMSHAVQLKVPLDVQIGHGQSWHQAGH